MNLFPGVLWSASRLLLYINHLWSAHERWILTNFFWRFFLPPAVLHQPSFSGSITAATSTEYDYSSSLSQLARPWVSSIYVKIQISLYDFAYFFNFSDLIALTFKRLYFPAKNLHKSSNNIKQYICCVFFSID